MLLVLHSLPLRAALEQAHGTLPVLNVRSADLPAISQQARQVCKCTTPPDMVFPLTALLAHTVAPLSCSTHGAMQGRFSTYADEAKTFRGHVVF